MIREERGEEIWKEKIKNLKIRNFYFDFTPSNLISFFVTEKGISRRMPGFREEIADEIIEIKKILEEKNYHIVGKAF